MVNAKRSAALASLSAARPPIPGQQDAIDRVIGDPGNHIAQVSLCRAAPVHVRPADRASSGRTQPAPLSPQMRARRAPRPTTARSWCGPVRSENLHSCIVGVQHRPGADVATYHLNHRIQHCSHAAHPVCQGGGVEIDPFSRVDRTLTIQGQAIGVFRHRDVGKQPRPWPAALDRQRWQRRLWSHRPSSSAWAAPAGS
jgi:hypothetical protein